MREDATEIFVPDAGEGGARECVVLECELPQGCVVAAGEILARLRSGSVNMGVQAPIGGTLVTLHARVGATMGVGDLLAEVVPSAAVTALQNRAPHPRSASSAAMLSRAPLGIAVTISATAFVWPMAVLVVAIVIATLLVAARDVDLGEHATGWADVVVLPLRLLRGTARRVASTIAAFAPIVAGLARIAVWCALAVAIPAALGCLAWLATEGTAGLVAAIRLAVYGHALQMFALLASFSILRRTMASDVIASALRSAFQPLPEPVLAGAAVVGLAWIGASAVLIAPRNWAPAASFAGVVEVLPARLRHNIDDLRASIVAGEARRVVQCVTGHGTRHWHTPRAFVGGGGHLLLGIRPGRNAAGRRSFAILALALQNEVAPSGVTVSLVPAQGLRAVSFTTLSANRPVKDATRILERFAFPASIAARVPRAGDVTRGDVDVALGCSAAAI